MDADWDDSWIKASGKFGYDPQRSANWFMVPKVAPKQPFMMACEQCGYEFTLKPMELIRTDDSRLPCPSHGRVLPED